MLLLKEKATQDNSKYETLAVPVRTVGKSEPDKSTNQIQREEKKQQTTISP